MTCYLDLGRVYTLGIIVVIFMLHIFGRTAFGQVEISSFFTTSIKINAPQETVQNKVASIVQGKGRFDYDVTARTADPTVLVLGDFLLRINDVPFTLHLRKKYNHTEVELESRKPDLTPEEKEGADIFLYLLAERIKFP